MLDNIFQLKSLKIKVVVIATITVILLIFLPIFSKFTENTASSEVVINNGYVGTPSIEGGNNYVSIDNLGTEEDVKRYLEQSGSYTSVIKTSNEAQLQWYKKLTSEMEKTYVEGTSSNEKANIGWQYAVTNSCLREYAGDYSIDGDECEYNGQVINSVGLDKATYYKTCKDDNKPVFPISKVPRFLYYSVESTHIVGGKILGKYPDILVSATLANTYSLLDQNNTQGDTIKDQISELQEALKRGQVSAIFADSILSQLYQSLVGWYARFENVASADAALSDIFDEGSLYTTFRFMSDSKCAATDVPRYMNFSGDKHKVTNEYGESVDYTCVKSLSLETECVEKTETCTRTNPETNEVESYSCKKEYADNIKTSDGYVDSYYVSKSTGEKWCDYEGDYQLQVEWICKPTTESPVKCSVSPVWDDRGEILYYRCSGIDENEVRTKIVDPVFDAYEKNELDENGYLTHDSATKYVYAMDEEDEKKKSTGTNPKGYKISEETRKLVTKHIVMEILGQIEGRDAAVATEDGNFYLQSYNKVLNEEQYKDALKNTIFVKDNILRKDGKLDSSDDKDKLQSSAYSEKLFGVFYSEYNPSFDNWDEATIEQQKRADISTKNSLILEIFSTYEYVSYYLEEYSNDSPIKTGSGLSQVDPDGFQMRTSAPLYEGDYAHHLYGECAWYATGRIKEILGNSNIDISANGGDFCSTAKRSYPDDFEYVYDSTKPRKGSVISWKGTTSATKYGHVAIVEAVNYDSGGNVESITISEAGLGFGMSTADKNFLWTSGNGTYENRKAKCEKNGVNKCWNTQTISIDKVSTYNGSSYKFECYIYLLKNDYQGNDKIKDFLISSEGVIAYDSNGNKDNDGKYFKLIKTESINGISTISASAYGLMLGLEGDTFSIKNDSGEEYSIKLTEGSLIERWAVDKYWMQQWNDRYIAAVKKVISSNNMDKVITKDYEIDALASVAYAFGENSRHIDALVKAYKNGGYKGLWDYWSTLVYGDGILVGKSDESVLYQAYFHRRDCEFDMFKNGIYSMDNPRKFKFYTPERLKEYGYTNSCSKGSGCYVSTSNPTFPDKTSSYIVNYYTAAFNSKTEYNLSNSVGK